MPSLDCVCGRRLAGETEEELLEEVERHVREVVLHAELLAAGDDVAQLHDDGAAGAA